MPSFNIVACQLQKLLLFHSIHNRCNIRFYKISIIQLYLFHRSLPQDQGLAFIFLQLLQLLLHVLVPVDFLLELLLLFLQNLDQLILLAFGFDFLNYKIATPALERALRMTFALCIFYRIYFVFLCMRSSKYKTKVLLFLSFHSLTCLAFYIFYS